MEQQNKLFIPAEQVIEMASPQLENGFTRIANEILEALAKVSLNGTQWRILMVVFRHTYGFSRKDHEMSLSFLSDATLCDKRQIQRELKELEARKIITQVIVNGVKRVISFNKNFDTWIYKAAIGEKVIGESTIGETANATIGENTKGAIGETTNQEINNINKNIKKEHVENFFEKLWSLYPRKKGKGAVSYTQKKKLFNIGYDEIARSINRYKEEVKGKDIQYIQYGSSFFNHGFEDYLDKNYQQPMLVENRSRYKDMTNYEP